MNNMCICATKRKTRHRKSSFFMKKWPVTLRSSSEIIVFLGDFNGHVGKCADGFEGVQGGMVLGKEMKEEDCWSSVMKKSCAWQKHGLIREKENHV